MITNILLTAALSAAALGATPTTAPAPDAGTNTLVVFSENVSNVVLETPHATATRLAQMHTGDLLDLVEPQTVSAAWGEMWHVRLDDGTTGYIASKVVVPLPTTSMSDLTQMSMIVSPEAGNASWLSGLAAGSSAAFLYPHTLSDRVGVPALGDVLECNTVDTLGTAGMLGEVSFRACDVNGTLSYIRTEHVAPLPDLTTVEWTGSITTSQETPVYSSPAASKDTAPTGLIPADLTVQIGAPSGAFTPVRLDGEEAWAPTKILMGTESLSDKIKAKAGAALNKTKEVASDAKDAVTDKIENTDIKPPAVVSQVKDVPALILSGILALLTLVLAWVRRIGILPIPRIARRALNVVAVVPLVMLANAAPIASYGWMLWLVLGVTAAVAAGVLSGFVPDLKRIPAVARTRKAQIVAGVAVVGGALTGAAVTGFAGWLAPVVTAIVALAAAAGYLLSAPEKDADASPAAPTDETQPEVEEETE